MEVKLGNKLKKEIALTAKAFDLKNAVALIIREASENKIFYEKIMALFKGINNEK